MRAVAMKNGRLVVKDVSEPKLGPGQILVAPIATGVCGSDLSALEHTAEFLDASRRSEVSSFIFDPTRDLVFGHEFTSRVLDVGPGVDGYEPGDQLLNTPIVIDGAGVLHCVGYATDYPGALAERVVVQDFGQLKIPAGMSPYLPAVADPLCTGLNAVVRSAIQPPHGAVVTGCGAVGLGAVWELAQRGISPIVASDPSPIRRQTALQFGATDVIDPLSDDPVRAWRDIAAADARLFIYECSGKVGLLDTLIAQSPSFTKVFIAGLSMLPDTFSPVVGIFKNISIQFCYGPDSDGGYPFAETFQHIVDGTLPAEKLITGYAGYDAAEEVFARLRPAAPGDIDHMRILIVPDLEGGGIRTPDEYTPAPVS